METLFLTPGDDFLYTTTVTDSVGVVYNLTGTTLWFTVKRRLSDSDTNAIAKLYRIVGGAGDGITVSAPLTGVASIRLTPTQTDDFTQANHRWSLQLQDSAGVVRDIDDGILVVRKKATERTTTP